jgi:Spy/CpxP family protein refolding chaperone
MEKARMEKLMMAAAGVLALCAAALLFQGCRQDRPAGVEFAVDYLAEALDLTAAQRGALERIAGELLAERAALRAAREKAHHELEALLAAETLDVDRLKGLWNDQREGMERIVALAVERLAAIHATLSAEQKAKLVAKLERFHRLHSGRCGRAGRQE